MEGDLSGLAVGRRKKRVEPFLLPGFESGDVTGRDVTVKEEHETWP